MEAADFFRCPIDAMIDLRHPLAVLATWLPWSVIETSLAQRFERKVAFDLAYFQSQQG